jgi:hypothetical protein
MDEKFKIQFRIPIDSTDRTIILNADATLHHSSPHYKITNINIPGADESKAMLLPDIDIKCVYRDGALEWVHVDSRKTSTLSIAAGHAIHQNLQSDLEIAEDTAENED